MKKFAFSFGYLPITSYSGFSNQLHLSDNIFTIVISALKRARLINSETTPNIRFASRTDRGVGALNQVVSLKSPKIPILSEINSYLPDSIRALGFTEVPDNFQPRKDAELRTYSYFLSTSNDFDLPLAQKTLGMLVGEHDFRNFAKRDTTKEKRTIKTIEEANIIPVGINIYQIRISSKSFLWQMVRRIVGHLIEVTDRKSDSKSTLTLLESESVKFKPKAASPENLVLENIHYKGITFQYDQKALRLFHLTLTECLMATKAKAALYNFFTSHLQEKYNELIG
jgi:tRNA pseudouridine38-40 synthase